MRLQEYRSVVKVTIDAFILVALSLVPFGCAAVQDHVLATTTTVIGVQIHQKDGDKTPELKIGYARSEFTFVPTPSGNPRNSAEVLMEINAQGNFGLGVAYQGGVYQRLAVGQIAVTQPGAAFMMAKNSNGTLDVNTANAVSQALQNIPETPGDALAAREPLRKAYLALSSTKKAVFDAAVKAVAPDYGTFSNFLIGDPKPPNLETVKKVRQELEKDKEIKTKLDEIEGVKSQ
jgi:hypothetical protein